MPIAELPNTCWAVDVELDSGVVFVVLGVSLEVDAVDGSPTSASPVVVGTESLTVVEVGVSGTATVDDVGGRVDVGATLGVDEAVLLDVVLPGPAEMAVIAKLGEVFPESPITV